jgi:hypothetical protein
MIWVVIPHLTTNTPSIDTKNALRFIVFLQYLPRLFRLFPFTSNIVNTTGVLMETAWAGAAFNLLLYILASHVSHPRPIFVSVSSRDCVGCLGSILKPGRFAGGGRVLVHAGGGAPDEVLVGGLFG